MGRLLLPLAAAILAAVLGAGLADVLTHPPQPVGAATAEQEATQPPPPPVQERVIVELGRRVIVPVVIERETRALVLFEIALDVPAPLQERAHSALPWIRDRFLAILVSHAAARAFDAKTLGPEMIGQIREQLAASVREILREEGVEVLILEAILRGA